LETAVVELENLKVKLGRREILHGITCRLGVSGTGKAVGLLGPNGAGKSTLILTLLGFLKPSAGRARILGMDCQHNMGEARSRLGYMPENDSFVGEMTAVTFVRQMAEMSGLPPKAALEKAHEVLFHVGLGESRYRELRTYSYGMKQMAKLAQAIVHGPELVVLGTAANGPEALALIDAEDPDIAFLDIRMPGLTGLEAAREIVARNGFADRITVNPEQCGGRPCVRGLRIRVTDVLDLLASGLSPEQVLEELPDLEVEDISACLRFASRRLDHPIVAA